MSATADTADLSLPTRSSRLLSLVQMLWNYGVQLSASLREHPPTTAADKAHLKRTFGNSSVMAILVRLSLGMKRALFLAERITKNAALIDAGSQPEPEPPPRPRAIRPRPPKPYPEPRPTDETIALVARLPRLNRIARKILRQPIGEVLADICRELGISHDHPLWDELHAVITEFGGTLVTRAKNKLKQVFPPPNTPDAAPTSEPTAEPEPASTGPPLPAAA